MESKNNSQEKLNNDPNPEEGSKIEKDNKAIEFGDEEYFEYESSYDDDYENFDHPLHEYSDRYYGDDDPFTPEERASLDNSWDK